jgi:hypothetical protein
VTDIVIQAENLGKKYTIGHQAANGRYVALRDVLVQNARTFWRTTTDLLRGRPIIQGNALEEVWALKDVSVEIRRGDCEESMIQLGTLAPGYGTFPGYQRLWAQDQEGQTC